MNWIEINLPWSETYNPDAPRPQYEEYPSLDEEYLSLDEEVKEHFGYTEAELAKEYFGEEDKHYISSKTFGEYHRISSQDEFVYLNQPEKDEKLRALDNKSVNAVLDFFPKMRAINAWLDEHPTIKLIEAKNAVIRDAHKEEQKKNANSFTGRGLNKSGTLIEIKKSDGSVCKMLIGDINEQGGVCDDCRGINGDDVVVRYCIVWDSGV